MAPFLEVMGGSLVFVFIAWSIPNKAASLMGGTVSASFAGVFATSNLVQSVTKSVITSNPVTGATNRMSQGIKAIRDIYQQSNRGK